MNGALTKDTKKGKDNHLETVCNNLKDKRVKVGFEAKGNEAGNGTLCCGIKPRLFLGVFLVYREHSEMLKIKRGRGVPKGELIIVNGSAEGGTLLIQEGVASVADVLHEKVEIGKGAVRHTQYVAWRARETGLTEFTVDAELGTAAALCINLEGVSRGKTKEVKVDEHGFGTSSICSRGDGRREAVSPRGGGAASGPVHCE
ncbi:hypothetical protein B0H14DRAFT_2555130 [Mycena olivaceomarginata]|nr:hypothetical protein B0H14DRAFT_2555130 [Mycena olivaceomarginata]